MNTADRIKALLLDNQVGERQVRKELAKACSISVQAVSDWFNGKTKKISPEYLAIIANKWGSSADYLITGIHQNKIIGSEDWDTSSLSKFVKIPILEASLAAGAGSYATDDVIKEYMEIGIGRLEKYQVAVNSATIVPIRGDSMEPTLMNGDLLLINTAVRKPISGKVFAFDFDGDLRIKRFNKRLDGSWLISSDNDDKNLYRDETVSSHNIDQLRVIGQAVTIVERNLL